ncbi:GMC oxidoreductase-domain-containing protein [Collybia nuda]|uniref:GMC oxidoreductase-domain-containing protein n=1 Tax=Collybia nuda TaxID=64659 RepID=A0A9P6CHJ2_9AGAR|nr:GMC oxidoreductase-domain-containing protein [Collybia nuda]
MHLLDAQVLDVFASLAISAVPVLDLNTRAGDNAAGVNAPSFTMNEDHTRSSVYQRLLDVQKAKSGQLQFSLNTLATKVLTCEGEGGRPKAYGVTIAPGASLPIASTFTGKAELDLKNITVRREVIISAGTFQSPQLLSGIGDTEQLSAHGIDTVVNLPGVGANLQDHDEVCVIWRMKSNYSLFNGCTFGSDPTQDPCLNYWENIGHSNLYAFGTSFDAITTKSSPDLSAPNVLTYFAPAFFRGFFRGESSKQTLYSQQLICIIFYLDRVCTRDRG